MSGPTSHTKCANCDGTSCRNPSRIGRARALTQLQDETSHDHASPQRALRTGPVLLATDGLGYNEAPYRFSHMLAEHLGVRNTVVTVLEPIPIYMGPAGEVPFPVNIDEERRAVAEEAVRVRVQHVLGDDRSWPLTVRYGRIAREVADVAHTQLAAAIVVGAAPRIRRGQITSGERAAQMIRSADCPVISVAPAQQQLPTHVVAAVDFSPGSVRAAQAALAMVRAPAVVTLLYVLPPDHELSIGPWLAPTGEKWLPVMFQRLRETLAPFVPRGVELRTRQVEGAPVESILQVAEEERADVIAVGSHGPGIVERMFVGSVAAGVMRGAVCTVIASPPPSVAEALALTLHVAGTVVSTDPGSWAETLDGFTRRNAGRRVTLTVDDPEIGAQVQERGYQLFGVTYDRHDLRVEIMLGDWSDTSRHLTRAISHVDSIGLLANANGRDSALEIRHGRGQTLLLVDQ